MLGISRSEKDLPFPRLSGDTTSDSFWQDPRLPDKAAAILITATPGLRKGGPGNKLAAMCAAMSARYPTSRVVYTASTAVYGNGDYCDEQTAPTTAGRSAALQEIEQAVLSWENSLVLRVGAIVGPSRLPKRLQDISEDKVLTIAGDPQRPFPFVHQADLRDVLYDALRDASMQGIMNCVADHRLTYAEYYQGYMGDTKATIRGNDSPMPSRVIIAKLLWGDTPIADGACRGGIASRVLAYDCLATCSMGCQTKPVSRPLVAPILSRFPCPFMS